VAGEMVSLTAAETLVNTLYPKYTHAVVSVPDKKKGEALLLVTDYKDANTSELVKHAKADGVTELMVPRQIKVVDKLPVLGTGKIDYVTLQDLVSDKKAA